MIKVIAPAKLNFLLDILGVDEKNYHLLQMIMQTVNIFDTLFLEKRQDNKIVLECDDENIPCDESNICYKCAKIFFDMTNIKGGVNIKIEKVIPSQAGMAGGSSDGAGVLVGLNELFNTNLDIDALCKMGIKIGADIPFCLVGGTAKVTGIGEKISKIADFCDVNLVVCKPQVGISTKQAYDDFDKQKIAPKNNIDKMIKAIEEKNINAFCDNMYNALEIVSNLNEVSEIEQVMKKQKALNAMMTGSGSAVFGIFTDKEKAKICMEILSQKYKSVFLCNPINFGAKVIK